MGWWQKRQGLAQSKSRSEKFGSQVEEVASGFPMEPPRQDSRVEDSQARFPNRASYSGPLGQPRDQWAKLRKDDDTPKAAGLLETRRHASMHEGRFSESRNDLSNSRRPSDEKSMSRDQELVRTHPLPHSLSLSLSISLSISISS